jgi:hypothetical protein
VLIMARDAQTGVLLDATVLRLAHPFTSGQAPDTSDAIRIKRREDRLQSECGADVELSSWPLSAEKPRPTRRPLTSRRRGPQRYLASQRHRHEQPGRGGQR